MDRNDVPDYPIDDYNIPKDIRERLLLLYADFRDAVMKGKKTEAEHIANHAKSLIRSYQDAEAQRKDAEAQRKKIHEYKEKYMRYIQTYTPQISYYIGEAEFVDYKTPDVKELNKPIEKHKIIEDAIKLLQEQVDVLETMQQFIPDCEEKFNEFNRVINGLKELNK